MLIREAERDDLDEIVTLRLAFLAEQAGIDPHSHEPSFVDATRRYLEAAHEDGSVRSWFAIDGNGVVGGVSVLRFDKPPLAGDPRTGVAWILNMYVAPPHRGQGVGAAIFDACLSESRASGVRQFVLHATDDGRELYRRRGFVANDTWMELSALPT